MAKNKWIQKWYIDGSKGKTWTVAMDADGNYGCSCPVWRFKRIQCHHIEAVKNGASKLKFALVGKAELIEWAKTEVKYDADTNELFIPTSRPMPTDKYAKVAKAMLEHGYTMEEFREQYYLADHWTATYLFRLLDKK